MLLDMVFFPNLSSPMDWNGLFLALIGVFSVLVGLVWPTRDAGQETLAEQQGSQSAGQRDHFHSPQGPIQSQLLQVSDACQGANARHAGCHL